MVQQIDHRLDITGDVCPMTLVRVRLGLDQLASGQRLEVRMAGGEPVASIPRMLQQEGHEILSVVRDGDAYQVAIRKT